MDMITVDDSSRLYNELAAYWPLVSSPADYAEEAQLYGDVLVGAVRGECATVLELGCGGGNNASHMKRRFRMTLSDLSPDMLAVSQRLNPECEHIPGDMRDLRLGKSFDGVFIHDAIMYMTTEADLYRAIETASVHCRTGGAVLLAPDLVRETFCPSTDHGGHDQSGADVGGCSVRFLEWCSDPDPADSTYCVDYAFMIRDGGTLRHICDHYTCGLFSRETWLQLMRDAGLEPKTVRNPTRDEPGEFEVFVGVKI